MARRLSLTGPRLSLKELRIFVAITCRQLSARPVILSKLEERELALAALFIPLPFIFGVDVAHGVAFAVELDIPHVGNSCAFSRRVCSSIPSPITPRIR